MEERSTVIRKPTSAEELAKLHPVERVLLRVFEFLSSIKLAVVLMAWLMIECAVGTFVEAQVNTAAAKYFVFSHWRFALLLALLGLNILCAALIRFPWRRYQTGFVVTHLGLLTLLAGSLWTYSRNLDALLRVEQDQTSDVLFNPDRDVLTINYPENGAPVHLPIRPGPFDWGHRVFGTIPWRDGHTQEHPLPNGDKLVIKEFFANCEPRRTFVPAEDGVGVPAVRYRLASPQMGFDQVDWIAGDREGMAGTVDMGVGRIVLWKVSDPAELEHFIQAVPKGESTGLLGVLGYSHAGKHHLISVDELQKGPYAVPDSNITIELVEYLPAAILGTLPDGQRGLVNGGDLPTNPLLKLRVLVDGKPILHDSGRLAGKPKEYLAFGFLHELGSGVAQGLGPDHLFTYFRPDQRAVMQLAMTTDGDLGYRAFGSQGLIAAKKVEDFEEYPGWNEMNFSVERRVAAGRPDVQLIRRPLKRGDRGNPGMVVEYQSRGKSFEASLSRGMQRMGQAGDRFFRIAYDIEQTRVPFKVRLDRFHEPTDPGTSKAAMYTSWVTLLDANDKPLVESQEITMNAPLHYTDADGRSYTLYQSGVEWNEDRTRATSTYTVGDDPGLTTKYVGAITLCTGIFLMFYMGGYFKRSANLEAVAASVPAAKSAKPVAVGG